MPRELHFALYIFHVLNVNADTFGSVSTLLDVWVEFLLPPWSCALEAWLSRACRFGGFSAAVLLGGRGVKPELGSGTE